MKKELQELSHAEEEELVKALASLKVELTPEADFESRFLADFHNRLAESEVTSKAKLPFFVRVKAAITSPYGRSWVMGACAAVVVGFLVGGLLMVPEEGNVSVVLIDDSSSDGRGTLMRCDRADCSASFSENEDFTLQPYGECNQAVVVDVNAGEQGVVDSMQAKKSDRENVAAAVNAVSEDDDAATVEDKTEENEAQDGE